MMSGTHAFFLKKAFLDYPSFHFWWNSTAETQASDMRGFQIDWKIENGRLPDVREFVTRELSGNISTPGLGSVPPPNYFGRIHKYTVVIELPSDITETVGDGALLDKKIIAGRLVIVFF